MRYKLAHLGDIVMGIDRGVGKFIEATAQPRTIRPLSSVRECGTRDAFA